MGESSLLEDIALQYLKDVEDYDWRVCSAYRGNIAVPVTPQERFLVSSNARRVKQYYLDIAQGTAGYEVGDWTRTVRRMDRYFEKIYVPPIDVDKASKVSIKER